MYNTSWEDLAGQANYRPGQLARLCQVSLRTLERHFVREYGMSVRTWLQQHRLNQAYARISGGEAVKVVAYDLGFKQLSHFSKAFKQVHGLPPSLVRGGLDGQPRFHQFPRAVLSTPVTQLAS